MTEKQKATEPTNKVNDATAKTTADGTVFKLPAQVDISSAASFFDSVNAAYASGSITFDASKVDRITTPGVQILLSATKTAKENGGKASVLEPSESFKTIISDLGFSNQLNEWIGSDV